MVTTVHEQFALAASVDAVLARLADRAFVDRRTAANSGLSGTLVDHGDDGRTILIRTRASVPMDWLPSAVTSRVTTLPTVERDEVWDRTSSSGTMRFDISGVPASASGSMRLQPKGSGSLLTYRVDLRVDMPFVGGLVEKAVAAQIRRSLQAEAAGYEASAS
ncbi:MAG: DUF2505 domain-containing protein [Dermatophilaceae bacterium]